MRKRWLVGLLLVLLSLTAWLVLRPGSPDDPTAPSVASEPGGDDTDAERPPRVRVGTRVPKVVTPPSASDDSTDPNPNPTPPAAPPRSADLDVTVLDVNGSPVPDADVVVRGYRTSRPGPEMRNFHQWRLGATRARGRTDADGRISLRAPVTQLDRWGFPGALFVHAHRGGDAATTAPFNPYANDPATVARHALTVRLEPGFVVRGRVTATDQSALAGIEVRVTTPPAAGTPFICTTRTDGRGRYDFPALPRRFMPCTVAAFGGEHHLTRTSTVEAGEGPHGDFDFVLEPRVRARVRGRIVDESGEPVAGVPIDGTKTSPDGTFELTSFGAALHVHPRNEYAPRRVRVPAGASGTTDLGDIVLARGGTVSGNVTAEGEHAAMLLLATHLELYSEELGREVRIAIPRVAPFTFHGVGPGAHSLRVRVRGKGIASSEGLLASGELRPVRAGDEGLVLRLRTHRRLPLHLVSTADHRPVAITYAHIVATHDTDPSEEHVRTWDSMIAFTCKQPFELDLPVPGTYTLDVHAAGYHPARVTGVRVPEDPDEKSRPIRVPLTPDPLAPPRFRPFGR